MAEPNPLVFMDLKIEDEKGISLNNFSSVTWFLHETLDSFLLTFQLEG